MNITLWNSTEEASTHFLFGGISIVIHAYALILCSAIFDYQNEKPIEEKSSFDVLIKDLMSTAIFVSYFMGLTQHISLFTPPLTSMMIYWVSYFGVFLFHFIASSILVTVYLQHIFIFQPDDIIEVQESNLKWKSRGWKLFLTMVCLLISYVLPIEPQPMLFQLLNKDKIIYERYVL